MNVRANGITFNVRIDGRKGAPWLVFSNSLATDLSMWDGQVEHLHEKFQILRYDQRGHGATEAPAGPYDFDLLVADVVALYDALGIDRADFVGISMGGMTALGLVERHPGRVDRVVPCDCSAGSTPASAAQWAERIAQAEQHGLEPLVEPTLERWFSPETIAAQPALMNKVRAMIRATPFNGFAGCAAAIANFDFRPGLAAIGRPAMVIVGTKDAMLAGAKQVHAAIPGAALVELDGAGHLSNLDQPEAFNRALEDFLGRPPE